MTKKIAILSIVILLLGLVAFAADNNFGVGKTRTVTFQAAVKVGDKVLPAGEYKVQHLMEGDNHVMVFKSLNGNTEQARVKCNMKKLDKKSDYTYSEVKVENNERVLTGLVFQGDTYEHSF